MDFLVNQTKSNVPAASSLGGPPVPGNPPKEYETVSVSKFGFKISQSEEDFKDIENMFKQVKDRNGKPMIEVAKSYWENPELQRMEIEGLKRKRRG